MKTKFLIAGILVLLIATGAFALRPNPAKLRAHTITTVHTFTSNDKSKPVEFLGVKIESYKENGEFVHRTVSAYGKNSYLYSQAGSVYENDGKGNGKNNGQISAPTPEGVADGLDKLSKVQGFVKYEDVHGIKLAVSETFTPDGRYKQWNSAQYGTVQYEREINNGVERVTIVSVTDGVNPDEFSRAQLK